jgi:hypothetical protein
MCDGEDLPVKALVADCGIKSIPARFLRVIGGVLAGAELTADLASAKVGNRVDQGYTSVSRS